MAAAPKASEESFASLIVPGGPGCDKLPIPRHNTQTDRQTVFRSRTKTADVVEQMKTCRRESSRLVTAKAGAAERKHV